MILIIGGFASGKRDYVKREYGFVDSDISDGVLNEKPVLYNLQDLVAKSSGNTGALLEPLLDKEVVICNEVGCGIVPVSSKERMVREAAGRLCIELASRAKRVVRLQCGIPAILKG